MNSAMGTGTFLADSIAETIHTSLSVLSDFVYELWNRLVEMASTRLATTNPAPVA